MSLGERLARWAWVLWALAVAVMAALVAAIVLRSFAQDQRSSQEQAERQADLLATIAASQLQRHAYQDIEPTFAAIARSNPAIAMLQLASPNGFIIARYQRAEETRHLATAERTIPYLYQRVAILQLDVDTGAAYRRQTDLALQLAALLIGAASLLAVATHLARQRAREAARLRTTLAQLRDTNRTLRVLSDCNQTLVRASSERELTQGMCRILVDEGGFALAWIGLAGMDDGRPVRPVAAAGRVEYLEGIEISWEAGAKGDGPTGLAIRSGRPSIVRDSRREQPPPWRESAAHFGFRSSIALPLGGALPAYGALNLYSETPGHFGENEVTLLMELAGDLHYGLQALRGEARRQEAEAQIERQGRRFQALVERSADGVIVAELDGRLQFAGSSIVGILGYTPAELTGRSAFEFIHPDDAPGIARHLGECAATAGASVRVSARVRDKAGAWRTMAATFTNLLGEPAVGGIVVNFRDITRRIELEQAERESNERFRQIAENVREVFWITEVPSDRLLYVSPAFEQIWQRTPEEYYRDADLWRDSLVPEDRERVLGALGRQQELGSYDVEYRIRRPDGAIRWIHDRGFPVRDAQGTLYRIVGTAEDITERKAAEREVRALNRIYALLSGVNTLIVRVSDRDALFRDACRLAVEAGQFKFAWIGLLDAGAGQVTPRAWMAGTDARPAETGTPAPALALAQQPLLARAIATRTQVVSEEAQDAIGSLAAWHDPDFACRAAAVLPLVVEGAVAGVLVLFAAEEEFFNAAERRLLDELAGDVAFAMAHLDKSERIRYLASYDEATGLPNRSLFEARLRERLAGEVSEASALAVYLIDVDRFRNVNDSLGRAAGDALIRQLGERLLSFAGSATQLARIGSNQFGVFFAETSNEGEIGRLAIDLLGACFDAPYAIAGGTELRVAGKAGVAVAPADGHDSEVLLRNAEAALGQAKASGEKFLFYARPMNERAAERLAMETQLQDALQREEFVLHYQPKVDARSGRVEGLEALIRWRSPARGLVPPLSFIPILEETGLILDVGDWVLRRAARDHRAWTEQGIAAPRVAVNVSAIQLRRPDFVERLRRCLGEGPGAAGIDIEITESLLMEDVDATIDKLVAIREMGVRIAIDDFGTGYSSLRYLASLPAHTLKIDRSFVVTLLADPHVMTLVSTIVSMAHSLGMNVVAEGVDQPEQLQALRQLGCDQIQGYLISRPFPEDGLAGFLAGGASAPRA
jgi:diguanylate cyclase (GGDEF)-like protein/PAS domain S-box-containing protein